MVGDARGLALDLVGHAEEAAHVGDERRRDLLAVEGSRRVLGGTRPVDRRHRGGPRRRVGGSLRGHDLVRHRQPSSNRTRRSLEGFRSDPPWLLDPRICNKCLRTYVSVWLLLFLGWAGCERGGSFFAFGFAFAFAFVSALLVLLSDDSREKREREREEEEEEMGENEKSE